MSSYDERSISMPAYVYNKACDDRDKLAAECERLRAENEGFRKLLKTVEWAYDITDNNGDYYESGCPSCREPQYKGHEPDCQLASAIKEGKHG